MMYQKVIRATAGVSSRSQDGYDGLTVRTYKLVGVL